jgi:hypothetical protein
LVFVGAFAGASATAAIAGAGFVLLAGVADFLDAGALALLAAVLGAGVLDLEAAAFGAIFARVTVFLRGFARVAVVAGLLPGWLVSVI